MTPSPHAPLMPGAASHNVTGGPLATAIFLSLPWAKNPTDRLSGDQNGDLAPSVPASACAASVSSDRVQTSVALDAFRATSATRWPPGDTASGLTAASAPP